MTFVLDDKSACFTGDALLIRGCGRTDFQVRYLRHPGVDGRRLTIVFSTDAAGLRFTTYTVERTADRVSIVCGSENKNYIYHDR